MIESLISLFFTATVLLGSPGPAPLSLAACGASFGVRKSLNFLLGLILGLSLVIIGAALGITLLFDTFPAVRLGVQVCGAIYILYIAYKIATAPVFVANESDAYKKIPSLTDGTIFNLLNPKAYVVLLAIFSQIKLPLNNSLVSFLIMALVCLFAAAIVDILWLFLGRVLKSLLEGPTTARPLRVAFASLMVVAVGASFWV